MWGTALNCFSRVSLNFNRKLCSWFRCIYFVLSFFFFIFRPQFNDHQVLVPRCFWEKKPSKVIAFTGVQASVCLRYIISHWNLWPPDPPMSGLLLLRSGGREWPRDMEPGLAAANVPWSKQPFLWASIFKSLSFWAELPGVCGCRWRCQALLALFSGLTAIACIRLSAVDSLAALL